MTFCKGEKERRRKRECKRAKVLHRQGNVIYVDFSGV